MFCKFISDVLFQKNCSGAILPPWRFLALIPHHPHLWPFKVLLTSPLEVPINLHGVVGKTIFGNHTE